MHKILDTFSGHFLWWEIVLFDFWSLRKFLDSELAGNVQMRMYMRGTGGCPLWGWEKQRGQSEGGAAGSAPQTEERVQDSEWSAEENCGHAHTRNTD